MTRNVRRLTRSAAVVVGLLAGLAACTTPGPTPGPTTTTTRPPTAAPTPIIFVHGLLGSGDQYRSQQMRFASNGFPVGRIRAFDYNTANFGSGAAAQLATYVDAVRAELGSSRVHLVGHSLGTMVVNSYVGSAAAAGKVERFVLVDGSGCPTGNASCLVIRASSLNQTHVEAAVSAESFALQHRFLLGREPTTTAVVPEPADQVRVSGRVQTFQVNAPATGLGVQVWEVDGATGARRGTTPVSSFTVPADGSFGPIAVNGQRHYEFVVDRPRIGPAHWYFQPFTRSTGLLRLNVSDETAGSYANTNRGAGHSALVASRNKEWWGASSHGARQDSLRVSVRTATGVVSAGDVMANVTNDSVGIHLHDDRATPGVSSLSPLSFFASQPFQSGVDVFMPASTPPTGTITLANALRGDASDVRTVNVPNWPSSTDTVLVVFDDH